jgi:hypothetical protein
MEQRVAYLPGNNAPNEETSRTAWRIEKADGSALLLLTTTRRKNVT